MSYINLFTHIPNIAENIMDTRKAIREIESAVEIIEEPAPTPTEPEAK